MNIIGKILKGDDVRVSRLHTEAGHWCDLAALLGLVPAVGTWLKARFLEAYPRKPWWVWSAIAYLGVRLTPTDHVLEVGSGYSTLWLAERCSKVDAIEENAAWKERIEREAVSSGVTNITLYLEDSWSAFRRLLPKCAWDVIIIDGPRRADIFDHLLRQGAMPRLIVYDDTDKAENRSAHCPANYGQHVFRGFKPQTMHVCETIIFERIGD